jgi:signal transduction histidine kinase
LELLHQIPDVDIVGIADRDSGAPGLKRAREWNIPVMHRALDLIRARSATLIVNVTGDPAMERTIQLHKEPGTDVLNGETARLVWQLIQHERKLERELLHAEKLAALGSFAAGIAHDMNNPLQLILGLAENLTDENNLRAVHEQAQEIVEAVKRTSAICRDLTRYARRDGTDNEMSVQLNTKLDEALRIARYAVTLQDITVVKHYAEQAHVTGNPDELLHVFVNLITNAVHAMSDRGTLTLTTSVSENGTVSVSVTDTGCGISPDALPKIFEPLYTTKPPGKGTGLGLYNVMSVIKKMQAHIEVDSTVGEGSTFRIDFPPVTQAVECTPA